MSIRKDKTEENSVTNTAQFSTTEDLAVDTAVDYFNRVSDLTQVKSRIKQLYGLGIKRTSAESSVDEIETYTKQDFSTQVDSGMLESISVGFGNKVVNALATLFTEKGQKYTLIQDEEVNPEEATKLLLEHRKAGGYNTAIVRSDRLSIQTGSAALLMSFAGEHVTYQHISPGAIRALYHSTIDDGKERSTDKRDIEDATCVIIRLSPTGEPEQWNYLAIFGRSSLHPRGRYVEYVSSNSIEVPAVNAEGTIEFKIDGKYCNPLSHYAYNNPDKNVPEYPISVIYGGLTDSDTTFPVTLSLYNSCLEISCGASHTLSKSQEAASGTKILSRDETAAGKPLPKTLTGAVSLAAGQEIEFIKHDSQACIDSYDVLERLQVDIAGSFSVPDYMAVRNDNMFNADSGIALEIKTEPLIKFRDFREEENDLSVRKIFDIEKILIDLFADEDKSAISQLMACEMVWEAGPIIVPENKKEKSERILSYMEKGVYDVIAGIREANNLSSDEAAIERYELMKKRGEEYPPLIKEEEKPKTLGLLNRRKQTQQGNQ